MGAERGPSAAGAGAERFAVDDDAAATAGEREDGSGEGNIGESPEADAQTPARGGRVAVEQDADPIGAQVGEQVGEAAGRFAQVDRAFEGAIEERAPEARVAEARGAWTALGGQPSAAEGADVVGVEQLAGREGEACAGEAGFVGVGAQNGAQGGMAVAGKATGEMEGEAGLEARAPPQSPTWKREAGVTAAPWSETIVEATACSGQLVGLSMKPGRFRSTWIRR